MHSSREHPHECMHSVPDREVASAPKSEWRAQSSPREQHNDQEDTPTILPQCKTALRLLIPRSLRLFRSMTSEAADLPKSKNQEKNEAKRLAKLAKFQAKQEKLAAAAKQSVKRLLFHARCDWVGRACLAIQPRNPSPYVCVCSGWRSVHGISPSNIASFPISFQKKKNARDG